MLQVEPKYPPTNPPDSVPIPQEGRSGPPAITEHSTQVGPSSLVVRKTDHSHRARLDATLEQDEDGPMHLGDPTSTKDRDGETIEPRLIQALLHTMRGDSMSKTIRRSSRKDGTRKVHNRLFWIHPYTRMLYWSSTERGLSGVNESNTKGGETPRYQGCRTSLMGLHLSLDQGYWPGNLGRTSTAV